MAPAPLFTIVIPFYNREAWLRRTLDSVAAQTLRPLHVVLVDNASRDASADIAQRWKQENEGPDITIDILREEQRGAPAARNAGMAAVDTPWVIFFDSDDIMLPDHCEALARCIEANPTADIVGNDIIMADGDRRRRLPFTTHRPLYNHIFHCTLSTQRYAARTSSMLKAGPWDKRAWGWNDYELGLRLMLAEPVMAKAEGNPGVVFNRHADSITGTKFSSSPMKWEDTLDLCSADMRNAGRADLEPLLDIRRMTLAANYRREGALSESRRLRRKVLAATAHPLKMRLAFALQRYVGHGNAILARLLFPKLCRR